MVTWPEVAGRILIDPVTFPCICPLSKHCLWLLSSNDINPKNLGNVLDLVCHDTIDVFLPSLTSTRNIY